MLRLKEFLNREDPLGGEPTVSRDSNSPDGAYDSHKAELEELLDEIRDLVERHAETRSGSPDKWSHASDLATVKAKLEEVIELLSGEEGEPEEGEPEEMAEAVNHMGERTFSTYSGWKRACRMANPDVEFEGDADICNAKPGVGEWDGDKGVVYKK